MGACGGLVSKVASPLLSSMVTRPATPPTEKVGRGLAMAHGGRLRSRVRPSKLLALFLLPAVAASFAACGADEISPETVANAATKTAKAKTARVAVTTSFQVPGTGQRVAYTGEGAIDNAREVGHLRFGLGGASGGGPGPPTGDFQFVFKGPVIYLSSPILDQALPEGREWVKFDLRKVGRGHLLAPAGFDTFGQDPGQALRQLHAGGDVERIGEERIRGAKATRYRASVDLRRYPELVPERDRPKARAHVERMIRAGGTARIPTDVWIDNRGLVRGFEQTLSLGPRGGEGKTRTEFFEFGTEVRVKTPPEKDVVDGMEFARRKAPHAMGRGH